MGTARGAILLVLMFVAGCRGCNITSQRDFGKYYLVDPPIEPLVIYEISNQDDAEEVERFARSRIDSRPESRRARGLALLYWHPELVHVDEHGHVVSYDLGDSGVIHRDDYRVLCEMFQKHGKLVETVPGRKPPSRQRDGPQLIEKDTEWGQPGSVSSKSAH